MTLRVHPKIAGAGGGAGLGTGIVALLGAFGVYVTGPEGAAIAGLAALVIGWFTPAPASSTPPPAPGVPVAPPPPGFKE